MREITLNQVYQKYVTKRKSRDLLRNISVSDFMTFSEYVDLLKLNDWIII